MKFRKNLKRFFTLDRRHADGFTLVELIVVIAILAILAGVAVPAYSGYVTRANKQADITLVGEVAHALTLHYYNTGAKAGGYVTLLREGVTMDDGDEQADAFGVDAMKAVFGESWENAANLKYKWNADLSGASATTIAPTKLMGSVSSLTGIAASVVGGNDPEVATNIIVNLIGGDNKDALRAELEQYQTHEDYATIATNIMVKQLSDQMGNMTYDAEGNPMLEGPAMIALQYAMIYSMANSNNSHADVAQSKVDAFDAAMAEIAEKESNDPTGVSVMAELMAALEEMQADVDGFGDAFVAYGETNGAADMAGIKDAMGFVNSVAQEYNDAESLSNADLYSSAAIENLLNDYQNANKYGVIVRIDENGVITVLPADANPAV